MKIYTCSTTDKIINQTASVAENLIKSGKKVIVFAEDKITLSLEIEIANRLGGGFFDAQILTFKRYVSSKNTVAKVLSKESSVMLIRKIVADLSSELTCFKNALATPNIAVVLYELISQLESAKVTPSDLRALICKDENLSLALRNKIKDVCLVYTRYVDEVSDRGVYDRNEYLSLFPEVCYSDSEIKDSVVIISGYQSVTRQRFDVFRALYETASEFYAVVPYDENSELFTNETYNKLKQICSDYEIIDCCGEEIKEVALIKADLLNPAVFASDYLGYNSSKVSLYQAQKVSDEAEWLARDILYEVRINGKRFQDIAVAVGSFENFLPALTRAFKDYSIPFYAQKTTPLSEHPLCDFIVSFLDFQRKGKTQQDFIKIISSSLFITDKKLADKFINYVYQNMINRKGFSVPFAYESENLTQFESFRQIINNVAEKLKQAKTISDYVSAVKYLLNETNAVKNIEILGEKLIKFGNYSLGDYNDKVGEKIMSVLDEMDKILSLSTVSALDFKNIFLSGAMGTNVSSIPIFNDAVYVGECKDVKIKNADILYAVNVVGDLPFAKSDTALLSDGDLSVLDGFDVIVEPKIKAVNEREKENVVISLCSFTEKLKISYSLTDSVGNQSFKADVVKYLQKIFNLTPITNLKGERVDEIAQAFANDKTTVMEIARSYVGYKNDDFSVKSKIASAITATESLGSVELKNEINNLLTEPESEKYITSGENPSVYGGEISASVLESYFSCPYKNYASNVIKLKETPIGEVRVNETGIILHYVTENYVKQIGRVSDKISSDALVEEIFDEIGKDANYARYFSNNKLGFMMKRLKNECKRVCYHVYNSIKNSNFTPKYFEKRFGKGQEIEAIKLITKNGEKGVKGVVDRVDESDNYVRIIDYKSGKINDSDELFYTGNKIQLYLYMNAFTKDKKPAGAYYYPIKDGYTEKEETYTMRGKTVSSEEVIYATDNTVKAGEKSKIVNVALNKRDGKPSSTSQVLDELEMQKYLKYAVKISENCIDEIMSGYCTPTPYENACNYCVYGGMCGFCSSEGGQFRKVTSVDKSTVTGAVDLAENKTFKAVDGNEI